MNTRDCPFCEHYNQPPLFGHSQALYRCRLYKDYDIATDRQGNTIRVPRNALSIAEAETPCADFNPNKERIKAEIIRLEV